MSRVYFIQGGNAIKIGFSADLDGRIRSLNVGSPVVLTLIGSVEAGVSFERALHHKLKQYRIKGEWFSDVPEVRTIIDVVLMHGVSAIGYVEPVPPVDRLRSLSPRLPDIWGGAAQEIKVLFERYEYIICRMPNETAAQMIGSLRKAIDDIERMMDATAQPCCAVADRVQSLASELAELAHSTPDSAMD